MKLLFPFLLAAAPAFAADLTDGHYRTVALYCDEDVVNDQSTNGLVLIAHSENCEANGTVRAFARASDWEFWSPGSTVSVTSAMIKKCTSRPGHALPCDAWLYDAEKNFVGQLGDQIKDGQSLKVMNPYAFTLSYAAALWRNGAVVTRYVDANPVIFTRPAPKGCNLPQD